MHVTDPIADMLTRVRNASSAGLMYVTVPASRLKIEVTKILEAEGFIRGFRLIRDDQQGKIKIALKYSQNGSPVIRGIDRVSRPGCRVYADVGTLSGQRRIGMSILTTPKGVLTDAAAKTQKVGGEVLAYVW